jgi:Laminin B (Domain IV)
LKLSLSLSLSLSLETLSLSLSLILAISIPSIFPTTEQIITLLPYDADSNSMVAQIVTLPSIGTLYQLSTNYINFGYEPAKGTEIASVPTNVSAAANYRIVYAAPVGFTPTSFTYKAIDTVQSLDSAAGNVLVTRTDNVLQASYFHETEESWQAVGPVITTASWSSTSTGLLNRYIYRPIASLVVGVNNNVIWYFNAPAGFTGDFRRAYGGALSFTLGAFEGDFTSTGARSNPFTFVALECSTCNGGSGMTIAQRSVAFSGGVQSFSFQLVESASNGWRRDPKDSRITQWPTITQCNMIQVLSGLTGVRIYGDLSQGSEVIGLDSVVITAGSTSIPVTCY